MNRGRRVLVQSKNCDLTKSDLDPYLTYKPKNVYHLWTSHMYALSLEVLKKKLKLNLPRAEGPGTEQKLQRSAKSDIDG